MNEGQNDNDKENNQLIDDLKETVKTRFTNPVFFSYIFSWIIINWRFISFMFFSNETIEKKILEYGSYINFFGWLYPLLGVVIYLLVLNYIDSFFLWAGKHGYQRKIDALEIRSNIKMRSEVEIAKGKLSLLSQQIDADKINNLILETDRLKEELVKREIELKNKDLRITKLEIGSKEVKKDIKEFTAIPAKSGYETISYAPYHTASSNLSMIDLEEILRKMNLITKFMTISNGNLHFGVTFSSSTDQELFKGLGLLEKSVSINLTSLGREFAAYLQGKYGSNPPVSIF